MELGWLTGGEMGALMRSIDWSRTPVGPMEKWPQSLKTALSILLSSQHPHFIWWGPELVQFYNDSYRPILGSKKHPAAMGQRGPECWAEIWDVFEPMIESALEGESTYVEDGLLSLDRHGFIEESYFNYAFSPIRDETGEVGGVFVTCSEATRRVIGDRRLQILRRLSSKALAGSSPEELAAELEPVLDAAAPDMPFSLLYLCGEDGCATLAAATGIEAGGRLAPERIDPASSEAAWPLDEARREAITIPLEDVEGSERITGRPWPEPATRARVLPLPNGDPDRPYGWLVAGISPRLRLDDDYTGFLDVVASNIASAIADARSRVQERRRLEALAALDRAKTDFFHNISHEFRTPLTLLLGPLEENRELGDRDLEVMRSSALRLLRMVNTMLDFARIESGRLEPCYQRVDVGRLTADLAEQFRSLFEGAGLELEVESPSTEADVHLDRDLWEKLVFNLLSNAFKFTFEGRVRVEVRERADRIELMVSDTGVGIADDELPRLFERFHRVSGSRARSHEGTGIGLAFVAELARLHGGDVEVESALDEGSTFTVSVPTGTAHLPAERVAAQTELAPTRLDADSFVEEARRWSGADRGGDFDAAPTAAGAGECVLVVDDNADLRDYVAEALRAVGLDVITASDGGVALEALAELEIDLVIADVMMPGVSGIELVERLRAEPETTHLPVILLSARAGEEAKLEGLASGAEDYLVKPFSPRELTARARTQLNLARERRHLETERNRLELLLSAGKSMVAELDESQLADIITDEATRTVGAQLGAFFLNRDEPDGDCYEVGAVSGLPRSAFGRLPGPRKTELFEPTFRGGDIVRLDDVRLDPRFGKNAPHDGLPDGHPAVVSYMAAPVISPAGDVIGGLFFAHEEAGVFTAEHERLLAGLASYAGIAMSNARLYRELRQTERRKDEFLAMLGHELRNPLAPIASAAELLSSTAELDDDTSGRLVQTISRQAKQMARLVDDLLEASRIARGVIPLTLERTALDAILERAVAEVAPVIEERGHTLKVDVAGDLCVEADPDRLVQVFSNLLTNAARYTKPGGFIELQARRREGEIRVVVKDSGIGISEELLPRVFDLFTRGAPMLDPSDPGLGVGLTLVERLLELHGGRVYASSDGPGRGSEFTVHLEEAEPERPRREERRAEIRGTGRCQVLVVDDNVDAADMLAMLIENMGACVTVAYDGPSAIELATEVAPDLVILDIGLPGMSGIDVARALRSRDDFDCDQARIVALTGYGHASLGAQLDEAGFADHMLKPVDPGRLRSLLEVTSAQAR